MANIPVYNMTDTWNNASCAFDAVRMDVTNTSSAASSRLLMLSATSGAPFIVDKAGCVNDGTVLFSSGSVILGNCAFPSGSIWSNSPIGIGQCSLLCSSGSYVIGIGRCSGSCILGSHNIAIGNCAFRSICNSCFGFGYSLQNVAVGNKALDENSFGCFNVGIGHYALRRNRYCSFNVAVGSYALCNNIYGCNNTAIGHCSMSSMCFGGSNTTVGSRALRHNSFGSFNTTVGFKAGYCNAAAYNTLIGGCNISSNYDSSAGNTAVGFQALECQFGGGCNTAVGCRSIRNGSGGRCNVGVGNYALPFLSSGNSNIAIGYLGNQCISTQNNTIAIGCNARTSANSCHTVWGHSSNNVCNCVYAAWSNVSDCRDKSSINELPDKYGIDFVRKLKPVSYKYDHRDLYVEKCSCSYGEKDGSLQSSKYHYGFIAQDMKSILEELNITLDGLGYDEDKDAYRLTYEEMIAPIVKSIKQLIDRVELLENDNKALNDRVKILEQT